MQGRLTGKRLHAAYFLDHVLDGGVGGVQLPPRGGRRHEHRRRLRDVVVGEGLRRLRVRPRPRHAAPHPRAAALRDDPVRPRLARRLGAGAPVAARHPQGPGRAGRRARLDGHRRHRARVHRLRGHLRLGVGPALRRPHRRQPLQRRLLDHRRDATVEPLLREIRNELYAAGVTVEGAKGECNFGQHEIGFLYDEVVRTCDNHVIYKTAAKELAAKHGMSLTFMAKYDEREGNSCHIHLSLRGLDGEVGLRRRRPRGRAGRAARPVPRRRARDDARLHLLLCAEHQLLQAFCARVVRADGHRVGSGQPHLRAAGRRPRRRPADGEPRARRRRQPLPRGGGDARRRPLRHRARARARAGLRGQRLHVRRRHRAEDPARGARRCWQSRPSRARSSATTSSTTTSTPPTSSSRPSTPR